MVKIKHKKVLIGVLISLLVLLIAYGGPAIYFNNHFYSGSVINGIDVSGKTLEQAKGEMDARLKEYSLELKERGNKQEQIKAEDIGLKYSSEEKIKELKDSQKPIKWISAFFNKKNNEINLGIIFDKDMLQKKIDKLSCFQNSNIIEPKNASLKYTDNSYVIVDEVLGTKINKDILYKEAEEAVSKGERSLDLEAKSCYVNPQLTSKSEKVVEAKNTLNKYLTSKITYSFGESKEIIDGQLINKWISVDENCETKLDEAKIKSYFSDIAGKYNTVGKTRSFAASSGQTIKVSGGDYGWSVNTNKEVQDLIASIKDGKTVSKEPQYSQTAASHSNNDIGNTYVEIDMSKQHLWFYKNGSLVVQGDVVTGNISLGHTTPAGIYKLKYKDRDAVLKGQDYASPVNFWMPFNGGIGIHDASWRKEFGGVIYKTNGSHGCVNAPYDLAKTIFQNINPGTPIVCYY
ncbi:ErfK/YbiS/YcfS/YnhG [Clostridiales bacterium oral taxon 876 str. F0540]|nr:ErfK/YbiS/YcfS/YnhG [Clostridiales bacterium oral taxon 876 str. F0540]